MSNEAQNFDQWCVVELFGHQVIAGKVSEQVIGGSAFIRVDVPETDSQVAFTRFYGNGAIYSMTPVSEEVAKLAIKRYEPRPVTIYIPDLQLSAGYEDDEDEDEF